jgi:mRNA interferase MazF
VWLADLDPTAGHEQAGTRLAIIVSANPFNQSRSRLVVIVPLTRTDRHNPLHVPIVPPDGGLRYRSFALCDMVRSISSERLRAFIGRVEGEAMDEIDDRLRILLDI